MRDKEERILPSAWPVKVFFAFAVLLLAFSIVLIPVSAYAATDWYCDITSGNDGNAGNSPSVPFQTITRALQALQAGDTIHIAPGTYNEVIDIHADSDNVAILGDSDAIDGTAADSSSVIINMVSGGVALNGCEYATISDVWLKGNWTTRYLHLSNASNNTIRRVKVSACATYGIYLDNSNNNTILDSYSVSNTYTGSGYSIYLSASTGNTINGNVFGYQGNGASTAYGCYLTNSSAGNTISNNYITKITGTTGASIGVNNSNNNVIVGNFCGYNGSGGYPSNDGIAVMGSSSNTIISRNRVYSNSRHGIYLYGTSTGTKVLQNDIVDGYGAGVSSSSAIYVTASADSITHNNIVGDTYYLVRNTGCVNDARYNYYGTADSNAIEDTISGMTADSWMPFRFSWIDTAVNADTIAPQIVTNIDTAYGSIIVSWATPTDNEDSSTLTDLDGFRIYRFTNSNQINTGTLQPPYYDVANPAATSFTDETTTVGQEYYYVVTAYDDHAGYENEGWYSAAVSGMAPVPSYSGPEWYVDTGAPSPYQNGSEIFPFHTIKQALGMLGAGETIHIAAGTYNETITITADSDNVAILGDFDTRTITADSSNVIIDINNEAAGNNGVLVSGAMFVMISDLQISDASYGIYFLNSDSCIIEKVFMSSNATGMGLSNSDFNVVRDNYSNGNATGMVLRDGSARNKVLRNRISANSGIGLFCYFDGIENVLRENYINNNGAEGGIVFNTGSSNTIDSNVVTQNTYGMYLINASTNNIVANNQFTLNSVNGLRFTQTSNNNTIKNNVISQNTQHGIYLNTSGRNNKFIQNDIIRNGTGGLSYDGINIEAVSGSDSIQYNNFVENRRYNIKNSGYVFNARYNYYGASDSQTIADSMTGMASDSWVPFRFNWVDTTGASDSIAPQIVTYVETAYGSIIVSWATPTDNEDSSTLTDLDGFRIYRFTNEQQINTGTIQPAYYDVANPAATSFTDETTTIGQDYFYVVTAYDNSASFVNEGWYSGIVGAEGPYPDYSGPDWYVDTGSPHAGGNGSETYPFHTINQALGMLGAGETIHIAAGVYNETFTIAADSFNIAIIGDFDTHSVIADSSNVIIEAAVNGDSSTGFAFNYGIHLNGCSGALIKSLTVRNAYYGIYLNTADTNHITDATARLNYRGIMTYRADTLLVDSCAIYDNAQYGIYLYFNSESAVLQNNVLTGNVSYGIYLSNGSYWTTIIGNIADRNGRGINVSANQNTLRYNKARENTYYGIALDHGSYNIVQQNLIAANERHGLYLEDSVEDHIYQNDIIYNGTSGAYDGVYMNVDSWGATFAYNNIVGNSENSITFLYNIFNRSGLHNYLGSTDSSVIADSITMVGSRLTWAPFRFDWVDTDITQDSMAPSPPTDVTAIQLDDTSAQITWTAPATDENGGALSGSISGYRVYRTTNTDSYLVTTLHPQVGETIYTSFVDTNLTLNETYYYYVTAFDDHSPYENESWYSSYDSVGIAPPYAGPDWYVDTGSPHAPAVEDGSESYPFHRISRALQALGAGETIHIAAGVYYETITITADSDNVAILGDFDTRTVTADSSNVILQGDISTFGVELTGASYVTISGIKLYAHNHGINISQSDSNHIEDLLIDLALVAGSRGINVFDSDSNTINSCYFTQTARAGIYLFFGCESTTIYNNVFESNTDQSIVASSSCQWNVIRGNTVTTNVDGISLSGDNFMIESNLITGTTAYGLSVSGDSNVIRNNSITNNGTFGLYLGNGSYYYINQNDILENGTASNSYGLYVGNATNVASLSYNNIVGNHGVNIQDDRDADHSAPYNYFGTSDSQTIADSITMVGSRLMWTPFRFNWVDTSGASDSIAPQVVTNIDTAYGSIILSWSTPTDNEDSSTLTDLDGFRIYRFTNDQELNTGTIQPPYYDVANPAATSFTDDTTITGEQYYYVVTAYDNATSFANEGWYSAIVTAEGPAPDYSGPEWYVDTGSPHAPTIENGSESWPFHTIARAVGVLGAGETIHIAAGTYNETITITADSDNVAILGDFDTRGVTVDSTNLILNAGGSAWSTNIPSNCGIFFDGCSGVTAGTFTITNAQYGVYFNTSADTNILRDVILTANDTGAHFESADSNMIMNCDISSNNFSGVYFKTAWNNVVLLSSIMSNGNNGVFNDDSDSQYIGYNEISNNTGRGVFTQYSYYVWIDSNVIDNNTADGIRCLSSWPPMDRYHKIRNNTITSNGSDGIELSGEYSTGHLVYGNLIQGNTRDGIYTFWSTNNKISRNVINQNGGNGIKCDFRADNNWITNNLITANDEYGIFVHHYNGGFPSRKERIIQNDILNNGTSGSYAGIYLTTWAVCSADTIMYNNIVGNTDYAIQTAAGGGPMYIGDGRYNYYGTTDSQTILDNMSNVSSDTWAPFRFTWIDTDPEADTIAPAAPAAVSTVMNGESSVLISWTAPATDENGAPLTGLQGYRVYHSMNGQVIDTGDLHPEVGETIYVSFIDTGLIAGYHTYWVTSFDNEDTPNESWYSASDSALVIPPYSGPEWYVDTGSPHFYYLENGSESYPFHKISRALQALGAGETVHIAAGVYYETITITADSDNVAILGDFDTRGVTADSSNVFVVGANPLWGSQYRDILLNGPEYVTISDLKVGYRNGSFPVHLVNANNNTIRHLNIQPDYEHGINLQNSNGNYFSEIYLNEIGFSGVSYSISLSASSNNIFETSVILNSGGGAGHTSAFYLVSGSNDNVIRSNYIDGLIGWTASGALIYIENSNNNLVDGNYCARAGDVPSGMNREGIYVTGTSDNTWIIHNKVTQVYGNGIRLGASTTNTKIIQNDITYNAIQIKNDGEADTITHNNLYGDTSGAIVNSGSIGDTRYNYYGTSDSSLIADTLTGIVNFTPFRFSLIDTAPNADTIAPQVVTFVDTAYGSIIVTWSTPTDNEDSSTLTDLDGFRIYRFTNDQELNTGTIQPPYYDEVNPAATSFTDETTTIGQDYYYVVTAYDNSASFVNEGWYSAIVTAEGPTPDYSGPEWYVDTGSPHAPTIENGSESWPFHTIARALQVLGSGETVHIAAGEYCETITLFSDSDDVRIIGDFDTRGVTADSLSVIINAGDPVTANSHGALLNGCRDVTISQLTVHNGWGGVYLSSGATSCTVTNIIAHSNENGIYLNGAKENVIDQNYVYSNLGDGIKLDPGADSNDVTRNVVTLNADEGIVVTTSDTCYLAENIVTGNMDDGILIRTGSDAATVYKNIVSSNGDDGISFAECRDIIMTANTVSSNPDLGVYFYTSGAGFDNNILTANTINNNRIGILIRDANSADTVVRNNIYSNTDYNIQHEGTTFTWAQFNYYGTSDTQAIYDKLLIPADTLTWVPFRFIWVDTDPNNDSVASVPPTSLTAVGLDDTSITVSWTAPALNEDGSAVADLQGYRVYRTLDPQLINTGDLQTELILDYPSTVTSFIDTGLSVSSRYYYYVTAYDNHDTPNESWYCTGIEGMPAYLGPHWYVAADTGNDVTGNGSIDHPFATINRALEILDAGETVHIAAGTYNETALIHADSDNVFILGDYDTGAVSDSSNVIINAGNKSLAANTGVFVAGADSVWIQDLTVRAAKCGVHLLNSGSSVIHNVISTQNTWGLCLENSNSARLTSLTVTANQPSPPGAGDGLTGYGIYIFNSPLTVITHSAANSNEGSDAGDGSSNGGPVYGLYIEDSDSVVLFKNTASSNRGGDFVGSPPTMDLGGNCYGIYLEHSNFTLLEENLLDGNSFGSGGGMSNGEAYGIYLAEVSSSNILNDTITNLPWSNAMGGGGYGLMQNTPCDSNFIKGNYISTASFGYSLSGVNHVVEDNYVRGCYSSGFYLGLDQSRLENNTATLNDHLTSMGFYLSNADNNVVVNNTSNTNNHGFAVTSGSDSNYFSGNTANSNSGSLTAVNKETGFYITASYQNLVINNTFNSNENYGIYLLNAQRNTIRSNTVNSNVDTGIFLYRSHYNTVDSNTCTSSKTGLYLRESQGNTVAFNTIRSNSQDGIYLVVSDTNSVRGNTVTTNTYHGVWIYGSDSLGITNNLISSNQRYGINITNTSLGLQIEQNDINRNGTSGSYDGIYVEAGSRADTISHNNFRQNTAVAIDNDGVVNTAWYNYFATTDSTAVSDTVEGLVGDSWVPFRFDWVETAPNADTIAPAAPADVSVVAHDETSVLITWTAPATDEENGAALTGLQGYRIYKTTNTDSYFVTTLHPQRGETIYTSFIDTGLSGNVTYYYYITSFDNAETANESWYSTSGTITFVPPYMGPDWYVANDTGNDVTGNGSIDYPFATINRALETLDAGETVHIAAGTYNETATITADSDHVTLIGDFDTGAISDSSSVIIDPNNETNNNYGLYCSGPYGVTFSDFTIRDAYYGIYGESAAATRIINVTAVSNGQEGFDLFHCDSSTIMRSYSDGPSQAIRIDNSDSIFISGNYVTGFWGIFLLESDSGVVQYNHANSGSDYGIGLQTTRHTMVRENRIEDYIHGIYMGGYYDTALSNDVTNNWYGIAFDGADSCFVLNNDVYLNTIEGISCGAGLPAPSEDIVISGNTVVLNTGPGISLRRVSLATVSHNLIAQNEEEGIYISGEAVPWSRSNRIVQNDILDNGTSGVFDGIYCDPDAGADTITHNNIVGNSGYSINHQGSLLTRADYNYYGMTDTTLISETVATSASDTITWLTFRFDWIDTAVNADTIAPAAPADVSASKLDDTSALITWTAPALDEDGAALTGLQGYRIYRTTNTDSYFVSTLHSHIGETVYTSFIDTGLTAGVIYYYYITSFDNAETANESWYSAEDSVHMIPGYFGPHWYVDTTAGNNITGNGSQDYPFKTINRALQILGAGETVHIAAGTYNETATITADSDYVTIIGDFDTHGVTADSSNVIIQAGDSSSAENTGVFIYGAENVHLEPLRVINGLCGINAEEGADSLFIKNVSVLWSGLTKGGIYVRNSNYVVVEGVYSCTNANAGIFLEYGEGILVRASRTTGNLRGGIYFNEIDYSRMERNEAGANAGGFLTTDYGFSLTGGSDTNYLFGNVATTNEGGAIIFQSHNNVIVSCTAMTNSGHGFVLNGSDSNIVQGCSSQGNNSYGMAVNGSQANIIRENSINGNLREGLILDGASSDNVVRYNEISGNNISAGNANLTLQSNCLRNEISNNVLNSSVLGQGIRIITGCVDNTILNNTISSNASSGIGIYSSSNNNSISGNTVTLNSSSAVVFSGTQNNKVVGNLISTNFGRGIYLTSDVGVVILQNDIIENGTGGTIDAIQVSGTSRADTIMYNNIVASNSRFINNAGIIGDTRYNYYGTTDTQAIADSVVGVIAFYPFRFDWIDTDPNADTIAPSAPDNLAGSAVDDTSIQISWDAPTTNEDGQPVTNLTGYRVYRVENEHQIDTGDLHPEILDYPSSVTSFIDTGLTTGVTYYYYVTSYDNHDTPNESWYSSVLSATPVIPDSVTLSCSADLTAPDTGVFLSWNLSDDPGTTGYHLYRATENIPQKATRINTGVITFSSYLDVNVVQGDSYFYWLTVAAGAAESDSSNMVTAPQLTLSKTVWMVTTATDSLPVPGAAITYLFTFEDTGFGPSETTILYDQIPLSTTFYDTGGSMLSDSKDAVWEFQFSTVALPDQSWESADYVSGFPPDITVVTWVRWRITTVTAGDKGTLMYRVTID